MTSEYQQRKKREKEDIKKYIKNYFKKREQGEALHLLKYNARLETKRLIRKIYTTPCQLCESTTKIEEHHPNYNTPAIIYYLCSKCHKQVTANNPAPKYSLKDIKPINLNNVTITYN